MTEAISTAFAGLGAMGQPMAANLHRAGQLAVVWNRSPEKAAAFSRDFDTPTVDDAAELPGHASIVCLCVTADADVLSLVDRLLPNLGANHVVVDFSTVSPATAREAARRCGGVGAGFIDAPVSGGTEGAERGTLSVMVGGPRELIQHVQPILATVGGRINEMGPVGAGQATKAVNQVAVAGINQAISEAMAFAEYQDLDLDAVREALSGGVADGWFLRHRAPNMRDREYPLGFRVDLHDKDLAICQRIAADADVQLPVVEMTRIHYRRLLDLGHQAEDVSSLHRLKRAMFSGADS